MTCSQRFARGGGFVGLQLTHVYVRKTVGFSKWLEPVVLSEPQKAEKVALEAAEDARPFLEGANASLCKDFFGQLCEKRERWVNAEKDYCKPLLFDSFRPGPMLLMCTAEDFHLLAVSPAHHRRGLGSLLLRECLARADEEGAKTYIEASKAGLPLYLRHGWEPVDEIVVDLDEHGVSGFGGRHSGACLMRPAKRRGDGVNDGEARDVAGGKLEVIE